MQIECNSISKYRNLQAGDDTMLILPHRVYAVFDGATDTQGAQIAGRSPGQFAATQAAMAVTQCVQQSPQAVPADTLLKAMNHAIAQGLAQPHLAGINACTTAVVVQELPDYFECLIVGDSGLRINGGTADETVIHLCKDIDVLFTQFRLQVYQLLTDKGLTGDELELTTRQIVFQGLIKSRGQYFSANAEAQLVVNTQAACQSKLAKDALPLIPQLMHHGIAGGQYQFCNRQDHSLGYAAINGGHTQGPDMRSIRLDKTQVRSLELFTDGYFAKPQGIGVQDWETAHAQVETLDFHKTSLYPGVKGSTRSTFTDDRTVVSVRFV